MGENQLAALQGKAEERPLIASITLPKGGGAIRGIGEKFAANPALGTGSMSVPIAASPGRGGLGPQLSLSYDSGAGNGVFGFGWSLGLPQIARKTDKGLPQYDDGVDSDVFILSGAEDLVPQLNADGAHFADAVTQPGTLIHRYRPRVEGLFARIERWTRVADGDVHWRSLSSDNLLTLYGLDARSRIADPNDAARVFSWLICETRDAHGNALVYEYKSEDGAGVDLGQSNERNRGFLSDPRRAGNRYLKRIRYGNQTPLLDAAGQRPQLLNEAQRQGASWLFELVCDYGEHDLAAPQSAEAAPWTYRIDPFSTYRAGWEVRTTRRCRRILMFHHFENEAEIGRDCLVRSTDFVYSDDLDASDPRNPIHSFLRSVSHCGYRRQGNVYLKRSLPPVSFEYSQPQIQDSVQDIDAASLQNLPVGLDGAAYQWTDLDGDGIPGILTEQAGAWFYKRNLSPASTAAVAFSTLEHVACKPSFALADGQAQLMDLTGNGVVDLVVMDGPMAGFQAQDADSECGWGPFQPFAARLNRNTRDPNVRFVDLDGDGHVDVLISEDDAFVWHASLAGQGFGPARRVHQALDEESGPRLVFADAAQSIYLADMCGDGLVDLVRIRNAEICYWPNLGYGRFGAKVAMDNAPHFDTTEGFDQQRVRLADIDGSGTTDVIYLSAEGATLYFNQSGNHWSAPQRLAVFPPVDSLSRVQVVDLMANGTACLVWSSPLPSHVAAPMRYVDLMGGQKPHLLIRTINNLGAETLVNYVSSTRFYLADKLAGKPWVTKLPFPVHVVESVQTLDHISGNRFVTRHAYHHGYFDGVEREFRGFGMVEQWDTAEIATLPAASNLDASSYVPPVLTRSWFHTGRYLGRDQVSDYFAAAEYYREPDADAMLLDDTVLPVGLTDDEAREACRALKGAMLRQEIYGLDGSELESLPYQVTEQNFTIRPVQPRGGNRHAVFFTHAREALSCHYERNSRDPRVTHALTLLVNDFGQVLESVAVGYGRRLPDPELPSADQARQGMVSVISTVNAFTHSIDGEGTYRLPAPCETRSYEFTGLRPAGDRNRYTLEEMLGVSAAAAVLAYEQAPDLLLQQKRLIEHVRTLYRSDDFSGPLPLGQLASLALPFESYKLALTPGLIEQVFGTRVVPAMLGGDCRYVHSEGDADWWIPSGRTFLSIDPAATPLQEQAEARAHFFMPRRARDPFGNDSLITYDGYDLLIAETRDALDHRVQAQNDYRVLQARLMTDPNGNQTALAFDALGMVVGTAVMGKDGEGSGDSFAGFIADLDPAVISACLQDPLADPQALLQRATSRIVYDLDAYQRAQQPVTACSLARETHHADLAKGQRTTVQLGLAYSDGFGREIQKKIQAEPDTDGKPRWVGSGWTVFDNKGQPVRQYEPFFSATHAYEFARVIGVSPVLFRDPVGRVVVTLHPNHCWEKVVFTAWQQEQWDVNDTVLMADPKDDLTVADYFRRLADREYLPSWHTRRIKGIGGAAEQAAAVKAAAHAETPAVTHLDALGRSFLSIAHNRRPGEPPVDERYHTRIVFDAEGNQREVIDALGRSVMRYDYDMLGNPIHSKSMEAGQRWMLNDVSGKPAYGWDSRQHRLRTTYDALRRPLEVWLQQDSSAELLVGKTVYGTTQEGNLCGQVLKSFDSAGVVTTARYDFKGNALESTRQLAVDYKSTLDWSAPVALEAEVYATATRFDALSRPIAITAPDRSLIRPQYNEANLLERVEVNLQAAAAAKVFVENIDYNAKGQRERIVYGNGIVTTYDYDPLTFRLQRLRTQKGAKAVQDLQYSYDPAGNVTHIRDAALQTLYFRGIRVDPSTDYLYDATYRLLQATGREHLGQNQAPTPTDAFNTFHTGLDQPGDSQAMGRYTESYVYDAVGNILEMQHRGADATQAGWTRAYTYVEESQIADGNVSNRLSTTQVGTGPMERYRYDAHGSMTTMPHLALMRWNYLDRLEASAQQKLNEGTPETTYYVYDAGGQRVRKVTERMAALGQIPKRRNERIYLGGFEVYREYGVDGNQVTLARETLHVMDGTQRIALVETRTAGDDGTAAQLIRYQLGNHLGSASVELDDAGRVISYEEYFPYGATSYQSVDAGVKAAAKRYRYTGMERDEETGLAYHSARYYAGWLGRWLSTDPLSQVDGTNLYRYARNNAIRLHDPRGTQSEETGKPFKPPVTKTLEEIRLGNESLVKRANEFSKVARNATRGISEWLKASRLARSGVAEATATSVETTVIAGLELLGIAAAIVGGAAATAHVVHEAEEMRKKLSNSPWLQLVRSGAPTDYREMFLEMHNQGASTEELNNFVDRILRTSPERLDQQVLESRRNRIAFSGEIVAGSVGGQIDYGSSDLSELVQLQRLASGDRGGNWASVEFIVDGELQQFAFRSWSGKQHAHSEERIVEALDWFDIDPRTVTRVYSERQPCTAKGCNTLMREMFPNAEVTWSFEYGSTRASKDEGNRQLGRAVRDLFRSARP